MTCGTKGNVTKLRFVCNRRVEDIFVFSLLLRLKYNTNRQICICLKMEHWRAKELVCSRKGYWRMAKVLNQIFSKKIIAKLGYTSMLDYYLVVCEN